MENFKRLILRVSKNILLMKKVLLLLSFCFFFVVQLYAQKVSYTMHTVAKGETLSELAKKFHTTAGDIMRLNGMTPKSQLKVGEKIKIPAAGVKVVRESGDQPAAAAPTPQPAVTSAPTPQPAAVTSAT